MNEIINTTAEELEVKALSPELMERREEHIKSYAVAMKNAEGSAWNLARTVYSAIHDEGFSDMFGSIGQYAKEVGTSRTNVSKLEKVYSRKLTIGQNDGTGFSTSQLMEFGRIEVCETASAIEKEDISPEDSCKVIRKKVKNYLAEQEEVAEESEEGGEDSAEEGGEDSAEEKTVDIMIVEYNGESIQVINPEIMQKILELLKED